jgi:hypothetical protein
LQTSLDRAFKEISDLRKENLESVNKAQSEALELEVENFFLILFGEGFMKVMLP